MLNGSFCCSSITFHKVILASQPKDDEEVIDIDILRLQSAEKIVNGPWLGRKNSYFSSSTIVSVKLTNTENYRVWVAAIKLATNTRNKFGFIDGTCVKSTYASSALLSNQWERSSLLSRETLTDVKDAFAIIFREESHRGIASSFGYVSKPQANMA
ncbi:ribonuclease H-like domain-containing protein, partial [Tanacetum coccineum]